MNSIVVFDGTCHFVESSDYTLGEDEEIIYRGHIDKCDQICDMKNEEMYW